MANWIKCTAENGTPLYINLDTAFRMHREEGAPAATGVTLIWSGSGDQDRVRETPEEILTRYGRPAS